MRALKGGSYSHFPAQILTKSHRPTAQIPSSLCLSCSNLNPIPIFYCFFVDESQSQGMKSHFPSQKMGKSQFPFYPFRTLFNNNMTKCRINYKLAICGRTKYILINKSFIFYEQLCDYLCRNGRRKRNTHNL